MNKTKRRHPTIAPAVSSLRVFSEANMRLAALQQQIPEGTVAAVDDGGLAGLLGPDTVANLHLLKARLDALIPVAVVTESFDIEMHDHDGLPLASLTVTGTYEQVYYQATELLSTCDHLGRQVSIRSVLNPSD